MPQISKIAQIALIAPFALLVSCEDEVQLPEDTSDRTASGEVLDGSVSDAMITGEELSSQPPSFAIQTADDEADEPEDVESAFADEFGGDDTSNSPAAPQPVAPIVAAPQPAPAPVPNPPADLSAADDDFLSQAIGE